jgi:hypothetical protein
MMRDTMHSAADVMHVGEAWVKGAITVRNLPPGVAKAVREKARREKLSLNKAVVRLLEEATGQAQSGAPAVHDDLDALAGTWSQAEYDEFRDSQREHRRMRRRST